MGLLYIYNYLEKPPAEKNELNNIFPLEVNITILDIFDIDERDSSFDVYFVLNIKWWDARVTFQWLKDEVEERILNEAEYSKLWLPEIEFTHIASPTHKVDFERQIIITKNASKLSGDNDELHVKEIYEGINNPINLIVKNRIRFTCSFDNIQSYPFKKQICLMNFYIKEGCFIAYNEFYKLIIEH